MQGAAHTADESGAGLRVLVVDDDPWLLCAYRRLITAPHVVASAANADEARALLDTDGPFDLVLCDVQMPGESGVELYQSVRATRPALAARFVFVTGDAPADLARSLGEPAPRSLAKPFRPRDLAALLAATPAR